MAGAWENQRRYRAKSTKRNLSVMLSPEDVATLDAVAAALPDQPSSRTAAIRALCALQRSQQVLAQVDAVLDADRDAVGDYWRTKGRIPRPWEDEDPDALPPEPGEPLHVPRQRTPPGPPSPDRPTQGQGRPRLRPESVELLRTFQTAGATREELVAFLDDLERGGEAFLQEFEAALLKPGAGPSRPRARSGRSTRGQRPKRSKTAAVNEGSAQLGPEPEPALPFAGRVLGLVRELKTPPFIGRVAIAQVFDAYQAKYPDGMSLPDFKRRLVQSARARELTLDSLELPEMMDPNLRDRSMTKWNRENVHLINDELGLFARPTGPDASAERKADPSPPKRPRTPKRSTEDHPLTVPFQVARERTRFRTRRQFIDAIVEEGVRRFGEPLALPAKDRSMPKLLSAYSLHLNPEVLEALINDVAANYAHSR